MFNNKLLIPIMQRVYTDKRKTGLTIDGCLQLDLNIIPTIEVVYITDTVYNISL